MCDLQFVYRNGQEPIRDDERLVGICRSCFSDGCRQALKIVGDFKVVLGQGHKAQLGMVQIVFTRLEVGYRGQETAGFMHLGMAIKTEHEIEI